MIRILIADDHSIVREGLKKIIEKTSDMMVAGEATTGQEALDLVRSGEWDIALLDISMPGRGGLEALKDIKQEFPKLPVLMLSMYPEDQFAVRALRAGASGYLTKGSAPELLIGAIYKIISGGKYISPCLAEQLANEIEAKSNKPPHELLSDREFQVLRMLAAGKSVKEIAFDLSLSDKTVNTYRARIMEKTRMKNNSELISYVIRNGLLDY
jgi:two-component system, NarL family, invasion response regulator UvrY